jgi:hypothetical protein
VQLSMLLLSVPHYVPSPNVSMSPRSTVFFFSISLKLEKNILGSKGKKN